MKRFLPLLLMTALGALGFPAMAAGLIVADEVYWGPGQPVPPIHPPIHPPPHRPVLPPRPHTWAPLELMSHSVNARITDQIASTTVEQVFFNPNDRTMEGTFLFPMPKGGHLKKLSMEIAGKPVDAELLDAAQAKQIYEDIVRRSKDPALLEYVGRDLYRVRIFPIEPRERKRITIVYQQLLSADAGLVSYSYPLGTGKFSARSSTELSLKVEVETKRTLKTIYSPSHPMEIKRDGTHRANLRFTSHQATDNRDFQLHFGAEGGDVGLHVLTHRDGEEGYFLLLASAGNDVKSTRVMPKDVVFVLDTSGSMAGKKLEQAKKALLFCVANLNEQDRFEIVRFSTESEALFHELVPAESARRERAEAFIKDLKPLGGTAIHAALQNALQLKPVASERPFTIIFLTDGLPTVGVTQPDQIVAGITAEQAATTRIFCFGIGTDVNTHLLDRITERTRAHSQYVLPDEDLELKLSNFYSRIKEPVLANPTLSFPEAFRVSKLYPAPLPDLFKGDQLVVVGRYSGNGHGKVKLEGMVNGERRKFEFPASLKGQEASNEFIPRLWATRRIGFLLDEIRLRGENAELREEVTDLARRFGIVTPFTSYLIVEDESRRGVPEASQTLPRLQNNAPERARARQSWFDLNQKSDGLAGVANARSTQALRSAENVSYSVGLADLEAQRSLRAPLPAAVPAPSIASVNRTPVPASSAAPQGLAAQFVGGRSFYRNGNQWIDSGVQKQPSAKRVQLKFGSPEYFSFLTQNSEARPWLALGQQVQFVFQGTVYEVSD